MIGDLIPYLAPTVVLLLILASAIKILPEYERGVVFFLGRFQGVKGPGLIIVIPGIQQIVRVDLRVITLDSSVPGHHYGEITDGQLDWLRAELATQRNRICPGL